MLIQKVGFSSSIDISAPKDSGVGIYAYVEMTLPYGSINGDMARMANFGQWGGYYPSYSLVLKPICKPNACICGYLGRFPR